MNHIDYATANNQNLKTRYAKLRPRMNFLAPVILTLVLLPSIGIAAERRSDEHAETPQLTKADLGELKVSLLPVEGNISQSIDTAAALRRNTLAEATMYSQRLAKAALMAIRGEPQGFEQLRDSRNGLEMSIKVLRDHPDNNDSISAEALIDAWEEVNSSSTVLINRESTMKDLRVAVLQINDIYPGLVELSTRMGSFRPTPTAYWLPYLVNQLFTDANQVLISDFVDNDLEGTITRRKEEFAKLVEENLNGSKRLPGAAKGDARDNAIQLKVWFEKCKRFLDKIESIVTEINEAKFAARDTLSGSENLFLKLRAMQITKSAKALSE